MSSCVLSDASDRTDVKRVKVEQVRVQLDISKHLADLLGLPKLPQPQTEMRCGVAMLPVCRRWRALRLHVAGSFGKDDNVRSRV